MQEDICAPTSTVSGAFASQVNEEQGVFDYGRFECDSGLAYRSVCLFGRIRIVEDREVWSDDFAKR